MSSGPLNTAPWPWDNLPGRHIPGRYCPAIFPFLIYSLHPHLSLALPCILPKHGGNHPSPSNRYLLCRLHWPCPSKNLISLPAPRPAPRVKWWYPGYRDKEKRQALSSHLLYLYPPCRFLLLSAMNRFLLFGPRQDNPENSIPSKARHGLPILFCTRCFSAPSNSFF